MKQKHRSNISTTICSLVLFGLLSCTVPDIQGTAVPGQIVDSDFPTQLLTGEVTLVDREFFDGHKWYYVIRNGEDLIYMSEPGVILPEIVEPEVSGTSNTATRIIARDNELRIKQLEAEIEELKKILNAK